jgi:uncharacterized protein
MITDLSHLLRSIAAGDQDSLRLLLTAYQNNQLTAAESELVQTFLKQAMKMSYYAIFLQALLYDYGFGVPQDQEMAFIFMREAAAKGHDAAIYEIGKRFMHGQGVPQNDISAFQWLEVAANSPNYHPMAMLYLAKLYEQGKGVGPDIQKAQLWYQRAKEKGINQDSA